MNKEPPKFIYKYQDATVQSINNLRRGVIYFNSPDNFNDPYDCAFNPDIVDIECENITDEDLDKFRRNLPDYLTKEEKDHIKDIDNAQLKAELCVPKARDDMKKKIKEYTESNGISCFSEAKDNLLMWLHYGGEYKGFCLEFATNNGIINNGKLHKVKYHELPSAVKFLSKMIRGEGVGALLDLVLTKSSDWEYEKEWRMLSKKVNMIEKYPNNALCSIFFGPLIDSVTRYTICLIAQSWNPSVKFLQGRLSLKQYKVEFGEFTYLGDIKR